ncbi:MAG: hypothetical protein PVJ39_06850 [Gammaproteobacteria bacterium]|jgi:hypothetical protein
MKTTELTSLERITRIVIGTGLIVFTMLTTVTPLGLYALLPLIATYPIFAGVFGYDPAGQWVARQFDNTVRFSEQLLKTHHMPKHS